MTKNNDSIFTTVLPEAFCSFLQQQYFLSIFAKKRGIFKCLIFYESLA